ncbi:MAG: ATP-dependent Clp protease adaptor protein ClpS, partial [Actinomycetota bacterium]|nr:ATP-dependent Clp protease adaptor protein ClpS [Actinomycetota bacterium]
MNPPDIQEITIPDTVEELLGGEDERLDVPWVVIVWNDPVNTFAYVI